MKVLTKFFLSKLLLVDDYPSDNFAQDHLDLVCAGAQGNHKPVWFTDNPLLQDDQGAVSCVNSSNNQYIDSNYTSRLENTAVWKCYK